MISRTDPDIAAREAVNDDCGPPLGFAWTLVV